MRKTSLLAVAIVIGAVFMAGCAPRPEVTPGAPPPTPVVRAGAEVDEQAGERAVAELASRFPVLAPATDIEDVQLDDTKCVECHTDKQAVQELAVEMEEEELSEGEG